MSLSRNLPTDETKRANNNSEKVVEAIRELHRILKLAAQQGFDGTIAVELSAKDGFLKRPKTTIVQHGCDL